jgi:hypothetical protein
MNRYAQLIALIDQQKPKTLFEFGTWNGDRAIQMIQAAQKHNRDVQYAGVDLFEDATPETDEAESNVKPHFTAQEVYDKIKAATGLDDKSLLIIKANSKDLPKDKPVTADFVHIDGGHSVETIKSDFELAKGSKVIVLDDFYTPDEDGNCIDTTKFGCNQLVKEIGGGILKQRDPVFVKGKRCGYVQMAMFPPPKQGTEIHVKTKNVGSDGEIQANVKFAVERFHPFRLPKCQAHTGVALMCAGGPSLEAQLPTITKMALAGGKIFAVKSAHERLLQHGITPFACVLLDPRGHVKDFIDNPHPDVNYIVASMCHPSVMNRLIERGARAWLYHAAVGAGEMDILKTSYDPKRLFEPAIGGGCSSATRGILIAYMLGFRNAHLFGYDLCYTSENEVSNRLAKEKVRISVKGGKCHFAEDGIWTDYEKIAQAHELGQMMQNETVELEVHGGTVAALIREQVPRRPEFHRVFGEPGFATP